MIAAKTTPPIAPARWGWGLLLGVSPLLVLTGLTGFFIGPPIGLGRGPRPARRFQTDLSGLCGQLRQEHMEGVIT